ncbi:hypothetical protein V6N11_032721 [Hibiscus sabdariffa]|uniref:Uncharacterized protein n=1 Tax=Hibiscus sabdariffa TaxID=183260 RepID=A0ABR2T1S2_9ROSI
MPSDNGLEDVQGVSVDNVVHNATDSDNGCVSGADNSGVIMGSDGVSSGNMMYYSAPVSHHVPQLPSNQSQFVSHHVPQLPSTQNQFVPAQYPTPGYGQLAQYLPAVVVAGSTMLQQSSTPQALLATPEYADILTKPIPPSLFGQMRKRLGIISSDEVQQVKLNPADDENDEVFAEK